MQIKGAIGLGGATPAAVTAPAATSEAVASGGTPAAHTFGAFTDPDSRIASYSKGEVDTVGSSAWAGSGLGAYTCSGHADGDSGTLTLTALDGSGDPLATATHSWAIAAAAGAAWTDLVDLDYTGLDAESPLSDAAVVVNKGGVQFGPAIAVARVSSSVAVISTGAAGVTIAGSTNVGSLNFGANLSAYIPAGLAYLPLRLDMVFTGMTGLDSATDGVQGGMLTSGSFSTAIQERSVRCNYSTAGQMSTNASRNGVNSNIATGVTQPAGTFTLTTVLHANMVCDMFYTDGQPPSDATIQAGGKVALAANVRPLYSSALYAAWRGIYTAGATLTRIRLRALQ